MTETNKPYNPFTYRFSISEIGNNPLHLLSNTSIAIPFLQDKPQYEPTKILLIKKIPYNTTELDIILLCKPFGEVEDLCMIKAKGYAFVQFQVAY